MAAVASCPTLWPAPLQCGQKQPAASALWTPSPWNSCTRPCRTHKTDAILLRTDPFSSPTPRWTLLSATWTEFDKLAHSFGFIWPSLLSRLSSTSLASSGSGEWTSPALPSLRKQGSSLLRPVWRSGWFHFPPKITSTFVSSSAKSYFSPPGPPPYFPSTVKPIARRIGLYRFGWPWKLNRRGNLCHCAHCCKIWWGTWTGPYYFDAQLVQIGWGTVWTATTL